MGDLIHGSLGGSLAGPREPCIRWSPDTSMGMGNKRGNWCPIVKYRNTRQSSVQKWLNQLRCRLGCGLGWFKGTMHQMEVQIPPFEGAILGKGASILKYLVWAVQKWLNRLICCLGYVPGWAEGTLVPPGKYNWTICLRQWCGLMSNYFDHLLPRWPQSFSILYNGMPLPPENCCFP